MKTNPNDPINAALDTNYREGVPSLELRYEGLTKREYFAAIAMQGHLSSMPSGVIDKPEYVAIKSVAYADALIAELNKE